MSQILSSDKVIEFQINGRFTKRNLASISRCWFDGNKYNCNFLYTDNFFHWCSIWDQKFESQFPVFPYDAGKYSDQLKIVNKSNAGENSELAKHSKSLRKMSKKISAMEKELSDVKMELTNISNQNTKILEAIHGITRPN